MKVLTLQKKMDTVQVALRLRPMLQCELAKGSTIETIQGVPQVKILNNEFTFNHVFDDKVPQSEVYDNSVKNLVQQLFKGYNVTVIAYGQTGSGKTYTMGTQYTDSSDKGIIPRAVEDIFEKVVTEKEWEYKIKTSFLELYNEQLYDLLSGNPRDQSIVDMREDSRGVFIPGLTEVDVTTSKDTLQCLRKGSFGRSTGATAVHTHSSRSHAIFTIYITQTKKGSQTEALSAKFHLVDLAGSERSKKTKTTGDRFKEGVNINKGLFMLGNVISALGENKPFINYRDSKLTRLLQDSLGGNALTIIIACLSPDYDNLSESLNTLRYADRARRIKNKPIVNRDPKSAEISQLKKENEELKLKLLSNSITEVVSSCPPEHGMLTQKVKNLSDALSDALSQISAMSERALMAEKARDHINVKLVELDHVYNHIVDSVQDTLNESQLINLKNLKTHIVDLQTVQLQNEEEITIHERSEELLRALEGSPRQDGKGAMVESPGEDLNQQDNYLIQQVELSNKLQELTTHIARKKMLVLSKSSQMNGMQSTSKKNLMDLEQQIEDLLKEKEELICQLKNVQTDTASVESTEQRQNRLQELELNIAALNKKLTEQERLIKIIEDSDLKIERLRSEIVSMKQTKTDFVGQMKIASEKYKTYKIEQEKEMSKPKQQDHKRQDQMKKSENIHMKKQNVLKRKVKQVDAVKKRLKDAVDRQKNVQERRTLQSHPESVTQLINQELEVVLSILEAERTFDQFVEGQVTLNKNLQDLKHEVNTSLLKKDERIKLEAEINNLNENLELTSALIMDLQQTIEESDQENKAKTRWETIRSMIDAKCAITYLFEALADTKKETVNKGVLLQEIHNGHNELLNKLKMKEQEVVNLKKAMKKLEQESEEKILLLLRQLVEEKKGNNTASSDEDVLLILDDELSKLEDLRSSRECWMKNCKQLQKIIDNRKVLTSKENKPVVNKIQKRKEIETVTLEEKDDSSVSLTTGDSPSNNKEIPFYKRLQRLKQQSRIEKRLPKVIETATSEERDDLSLPLTTGYSLSNNEEIDPEFENCTLHKRLQRLKQQYRFEGRQEFVIETATLEEEDDLSESLTPDNNEIDPDNEIDPLLKRLQRLKQQPGIERRLPKVTETVTSEERNDLSLPLTTANSPPNNEEIDPDLENYSVRKRLQRQKQIPRVTKRVKGANDSNSKCDEAVCLDRIDEPNPTNDPDLNDESSLPLKKLKLNTDSSSELRDEMSTAGITANLSPTSDPSSSQQGPNLRLNTDSSSELREEMSTAGTTANLSPTSDPSGSQQGPNPRHIKKKLLFSP